MSLLIQIIDRDGRPLGGAIVIFKIVLKSGAVIVSETIRTDKNGYHSFAQIRQKQLKAIDYQSSFFQATLGDRKMRKPASLSRPQPGENGQFQLRLTATGLMESSPGTVNAPADSPVFDVRPDGERKTKNKPLNQSSEEKMSTDFKKRLFRFNVIRPVQPRSQQNTSIEYSGELTSFLAQIQKAEAGKNVVRIAQDSRSKLDFFKQDRLENTQFWPLISSMRRAYRIPVDASGSDILDELTDAFNDLATRQQLKKLVENKNLIWDHYIISLILRSVTDAKRAALVDCLRAVDILLALDRISKYEQLQALLIGMPVIPAWLINKIMGSFRDEFPFVIGVTDLMVVKEQWIGYQRTEIAHIENVMATEERITTRRQLDRSETTTSYETERIESAMQDTSTSIHSALSKEIESSISQSANLSTGATVSASYGPAVSVDTNASFDFTIASEEATSSAQEYAQDIVEKAVSTVSTREQNKTVTVVLSENENTDVQTFSNVEPGEEHVIGVYRHIDQIWQAQVFNYGKRLMLDLVVPEPSMNWRLSLEEDSLPDEKLEEPSKLNINPKNIDVGNYQAYANDWGASDVPAPPDSVVSVSKSIKLEIPKFGTGEATSVSMETSQVQIPDGYRGVSAQVNFFGDSKKENNDNKDDAKILINGREFDIETGSKTVELNNHVGTLEFGVYIDFFEGGVVTVRVDCEISPESWANWQNSVYDALKEANDKALDAYNAARKNKEALKGVQQETLHPDIKRSIERTELKRSVISMLASHNYEESGSTELSREGQLDFPSIRFEEAKTEGAYARFFEEAFEWSEMLYLYYPYYWGRRSEWFKLMNEKDPDYHFNAFLQSGSARVNLAIRPGFELAVMWFFATGQVWKGGPPPMVGDPFYVALIDEVVESKERDMDDPKPVGDPWTYSVPTNLVVLDPDDRIVPPTDGSVSEPF